MSIPARKAKARSSEISIFIDGDIVDILLSYPARKRQRVMAHFRSMENSQDLSKSLDKADKQGPLGVSVYGNLSFSYRLNPAYRHIEIMRMEENE